MCEIDIEITEDEATEIVEAIEIPEEKLPEEIREHIIKSITGWKLSRDVDISVY